MSSPQIALLAGMAIAAGIGIGVGLGGIGAQAGPDGGVILYDAGPTPSSLTIDPATGAVTVDGGVVLFPALTIPVPIRPLWPDGGTTCNRWYALPPVNGSSVLYCVEGA